VRRRRLVVAAWLTLGAALLPAAGRVEEELEVSSRIPGSASADVEEILATRFESPFARTLLLVLGAVPAPDAARGREALKDVVSTLQGVPGVTRTLSYLDSSDGLFLPAMGANGTFVVVGLDPPRPGDADLIPRLRASTAALQSRLQRRFPSATLRWTGEAALNFDLRRATADEVRAGERRAAPATLVLLVLAFGAAVAALLPIASGALAIVLSLGAAVLITRVWPLAVSLQSVVSMLGLGLGIDYALLTLSRFREAREDGSDTFAAAEQAAHHAGRTVALSGAAVAVGFLGLLLVPLTEIRSVAVGGLLAVGSSVLIATTLVPALLACLGERVESGRLGSSRAQGRGWPRWGHWVAAHPAACSSSSASRSSPSRCRRFGCTRSCREEIGCRPWSPRTRCATSVRWGAVEWPQACAWSWSFPRTFPPSDPRAGRPRSGWRTPWPQTRGSRACCGCARPRPSAATTSRMSPSFPRSSSTPS
jgi:RND superfamily putative drug exporter